MIEFSIADHVPDTSHYQRLNVSGFSASALLSACSLRCTRSRIRGTRFDLVQERLGLEVPKARLK
jgi:hypothetical protein